MGDQFPEPPSDSRRQQAIVIPNACIDPNHCGIHGILHCNGVEAVMLRGNRVEVVILDL